MYRKKKKIFCYINNKNNLDNLFYINILPLNISNPQNIVSRLRFVMVTFFRPTRTVERRRLSHQQNTRVAGVRVKRNQDQSGPRALSRLEPTCMLYIIEKFKSTIPHKSAIIAQPCAWPIHTDTHVGVLPHTRPESDPNRVPYRRFSVLYEP